MVVFLLGVAGLEGARHLAWYFILTVRINHLARCLAPSRPATPNRKNSQVFLSYSKFVFLSVTKAYLFPY